MSASGLAIAAALLLGSAAAPEETLPPPGLLEYLGSWDGPDDEWLIFDEQERTEPEKKRSDPEQQGDEAREEDHEN
jgi:hypothetical protein